MAARQHHPKQKMFCSWSKRLTVKQKIFIRKRSVRIISVAFMNYVKFRYQRLIDNWEDTDVISQIPVAWITRQLLVVVPTNGKRYGFNSLDLIRWMRRNPTNPCSRELISPEIGWRCIEIAERFIKLEHKRLGIQKRQKKHMNIWKCEEAQLQEIQCIIDRFHFKHTHREKERIKQEVFIREVDAARPILLSTIKEIQSSTIMNRITARITNDRVQSINYQCTVTNMKEKPMRKLMEHMTRLMDTLIGYDDSDEETYTSTSSSSDESDEIDEIDEMDEMDEIDEIDSDNNLVSEDTDNQKLPSTDRNPGKESSTETSDNEISDDEISDDEISNDEISDDGNTEMILLSLEINSQ